MIKSILVALGSGIKGFSLMLLKNNTRLVLVFGIIGALFLTKLFVEHPDLSSDTMALSVILVLASFDLWSRVLTRLIYRTVARKPPVEDSSKLGLLGSGVVVFILYSGFPLLIAGLLMKLTHLTVSAQVAFSMLKGVAEIDGVLGCIWLLTILWKGPKTISVKDSMIERIGRNSVFQQLHSFSGQFTKHFAK